MPFYEYQCSACGHHHEELQKITDGPLRKCPACGRSTLKRLVSAPVFRLKGGGWYETDFKGDKDSKRNLAGEKEPAAGEGPPAAASPAPEKAKDVKPEAKTAEKASGTESAARKPSGTARSKTAARRSSLRRRRPRT
ncbi:MAG: FmdB family zinc ribbon protein [Steroidobacteraceae bacterium]